MIAFVCNTPVQIIRALQMKSNIPGFQQDADIYIDSTFNNAAAISARIKETNMFREVICFNPAAIRGKGKILQLTYGMGDIQKKIRNTHYHQLVSFNLEGNLTTAIYNVNKHHQDFKYVCVEDAPGIYHMYKPSAFSLFNPNALMGMVKPCFHVNEWLFSEPEMINLPFEHQKISRLPHIALDDKDLKRIVNYVFDYQPDKGLESADILIMEEPFFTDGRMIGNYDYKVYSKVRRRFSQEKIYVKLHPRTKVNRFEQKFNRLTSSGIPWEVYLFNELEKTTFPVQIGIVCSTLQSDMLMFGGEGRKISLAPMFFERLTKRSDGTTEVNDEIVRIFYKIRERYKNPDNFKIVSTLDNLYMAIDEFMEG